MSIRETHTARRLDLHGLTLGRQMSKSPRFLLLGDWGCKCFSPGARMLLILVLSKCREAFVENPIMSCQKESCNLQAS